MPRMMRTLTFVLVLVMVFLPSPCSSAAANVTLYWSLRDVQLISASVLVGFYIFPIFFTFAYCCSLLRNVRSSSRDTDSIGGTGSQAASTKTPLRRRSMYDPAGQTRSASGAGRSSANSARLYKLFFCIFLLINFGYRLGFFGLFVMSQIPGLKLPQDHSSHVAMSESVNWHISVFLLGLIMLMNFGSKYVMEFLPRRKAVARLAVVCAVLLTIIQIVLISVNLTLLILDVNHKDHYHWVGTIFFSVEAVVKGILSALCLSFLIWIAVYFTRKVSSFANGLALWGSGMLAVPSRRDRMEFLAYCVVLAVVSAIKIIYNVILVVSYFTYARPGWHLDHPLADAVIDVLNFMLMTFGFDLPLFLAMLYVWRSDNSEFMAQCLNCCCDCTCRKRQNERRYGIGETINSAASSRFSQDSDSA